MVIHVLQFESMHISKAHLHMNECQELSTPRYAILLNKVLRGKALQYQAEASLVIFSVSVPSVCSSMVVWVTDRTLRRLINVDRSVGR